MILLRRLDECTVFAPFFASLSSFFLGLGGGEWNGHGNCRATMWHLEFALFSGCFVYTIYY